MHLISQVQKTSSFEEVKQSRYFPSGCTGISPNLNIDRWPFFVNLDSITRTGPAEFKMGGVKLMIGILMSNVLKKWQSPYILTKLSNCRSRNKFKNSSSFCCRFMSSRLSRTLSTARTFLPWRNTSKLCVHTLWRIFWHFLPFWAHINEE